MRPAILCAMRSSASLSLLAGLLAGACAGGRPPAPAPAPVDSTPAPPPRVTLVRPAPPPGAVARPVRILYGTDRAPTGRGEPWARYGADPGELEVGVATVTLPLDRSARPAGTLPDVPSRFGRRAPPDPARDVVLDRVAPEPEVYWDADVQQELQYDSTRTAVVFIHGFATDFETAVRRAAQVAADLPFPGAMLVYSWPSRGEVGPVAYFRDGKAIDASQPILRAFLEHVLERAGAERVSLVAHSMGTLLLARTLKEMYDARPERRFDQVVLAAPDIDTTTFRRSLAPALAGIARRVTVYASRNDRALELSQAASAQARVGQAGPGLLVVPGVDVVDASSAGTSDFGHGYYGGSNAVLADLRDVLRGVPAAGRRLERHERNGLPWWELLGGNR